VKLDLIERIDKEDAKLAGYVALAMIGFILLIIGVALLTQPTKLETTMTPILAAIFIPGGTVLMVASAWVTKSDRLQVENDVLRAPIILYGPFHWSVGKFKGMGRMIADDVIEFDATHRLYAVDEGTIKKALGMVRRKATRVRIIDFGGGTGDLSKDEKLKILHRVIDPHSTFDASKYEEAWLKEVKLPHWARHFTQINLRYEYYIGGFSIWQIYVVTAAPFYTEFQRGPYTVAGLRPFQFIDAQGAPAWLVRIGDLVSEVDEQDRVRTSAPIVTPFIDLAFSEGLMRAIEGDNESLQDADEQVTAIARLSANDISREAKDVVIEVLKSVCGYQGEELDSYKHGDSEAIRKTQKMESELFVAKQNEELLMSRIYQLQRQITAPPPPDPNKYTGKVLVLAAFLCLLGGWALGIIIAMIFHLGDVVAGGPVGGTINSTAFFNSLKYLIGVT
jgi:hypothetical protein